METLYKLFNRPDMVSPNNYNITYGVQWSGVHSRFFIRSVVTKKGFLCFRVIRHSSGARRRRLFP